MAPMHHAQPDLFAPASTATAAQAPIMEGIEPVPEEFIAGIRAELVATLERVTVAAKLPWPDLTQAMLAELRFESLTGWLPKAEAEQMKVSFGRELDRLYAAIED